ncbi:corepressor interacting with RBPJ 1-like [Gadus morhua]|uniref:corepressor interacting with RBPJ 1-like n=1 Tax=Gadus morhua TaxID=8049 RepID=UPI0011B4EFC1|nr:corepressor interacting with RBPJ 1-like [Gadus morhua]
MDPSTDKGPKRRLSVEQKENKKKLDQRRDQTRVNLGRAFAEWRQSIEKSSSSSSSTSSSSSSDSSSSSSSSERGKKKKKKKRNNSNNKKDSKKKKGKKGNKKNTKIGKRVLTPEESMDRYRHVFVAVKKGMTKTEAYLKVGVDRKTLAATAAISELHAVDKDLANTSFHAVLASSNTPSSKT